MKSFLRVVTILLLLFYSVWDAIAYDSNLADPYSNNYVLASVDTIPIQERYGDFVTDQTYNPFDIEPSIISQEVEYDPSTGNYIITERIGDEYFRTPTYMTFEEFVKWRSEQIDKEYFNKLAGVSSGKKSASGKIDPLAKIDISNSIIDRLFGGNTVDIQPQGNIDLTFGYDYQEIENPFIPIRQQRTGGFDFDMDIQMNMEGKIGEKLNLGFNYNTNATFDFDNKMKIEYDSEAFGEDDIIKKIEAGNVSLPLRSTLIQGSQSLFGLKTELQFGKLRLTGIASQQKSKQEEIIIQDGGQIQKFEVRPDEYDENRHFFLSHFNRQTFESSLSNLPNISSPMKIIGETVEVWITNDRQSNEEELRNIAAIADIAEGDEDKFTNINAMYTVNPPGSQFIAVDGNMVLPDNRVNTLFEELVNDGVTRELKNASTMLSSKYNMLQSRDFEVLKARKLRYDEYTLNEELGIISLNIRLRPNQVLAVSYQYHYTFNGDEVYQVGELTENVDGDDKVIYAKLLKSTTQAVTVSTWDLMMKNVYSLGAAQVSAENFKLDVFFENNQDGSLNRFLPDENFRNLPLLNIFNLDRLNSVGDPQPDGVFDFVPGVTIIPRNGSVIFPVLEPFGKSLVDLLNDAAKAEIYAFPELYDSTITEARELLHKNKFVIMGEYKAGVTSEISLGSWNIPPGSETVRVGSQILQKGVDYEIEYGIGRVKILNDAYLQQGVPIRITFEDNSIFSLQQKTMLGLRADYEVSKNLNIGATYLHLFERPFTEKVNVGDDPINNRIYGLDLNFSNEAPFITRIVDKLPFYSTKEKSNIDFSAEAAVLRPGHSKAINLSEDEGGVVSIDDFEGAASEVPLGNQPNQWVLSSTPLRFPESQLSNDLQYGMNRAKLNWYVIDRSARSNEDRSDSYTRTVLQTDLFPNVNRPPNELPDLFTFDLSYYPEERGPYNFDPPAGSSVSAGSDCEGETIKLKDPESRWGGIMRYINNNDFEATNVEFIEFWMMNPFMERRDGTGHSPDEEGTIYFNLGNVSEDILKDNLQFFENTIPTPNQTINVQIESTVWADVPQRTPTNTGFDISETDAQDVGLDGLDNNGETDRFSDYVNQIISAYPTCDNVELDPSNDDFAFFGDDNEFPGESNLLTRYSKFNNPQGNAPDPDNVGIQERGNPIPDKEDLNRNWSLDQSESFFEYGVQIKNIGGEVDTSATPYITDMISTTNEVTQEDEKWYRFRIPLKDGARINNIQDFRSIQFIRMFMTGFETQKTFRLAEFQFIRNQWRKLDDCDFGFDGQLDYSIDKVSIEENSERSPFPYVLPKGIKRERVFNSFANVLQDERALSVKFNDIPGGCAATVYKLTQFDMRVFDKLQMFVHAESMEDLDPGDLSIFVRIGKDFRNNYYEYEIPVTLSDPDGIGNNPEENAAEVWREENMFDFNLDLFTELKKERNQNGEDYTILFSGTDPEKEDAVVSIIGNPSLGYVKGIQIGIRNKKGQATKLSGEVWVNELRAVGLDERGGVAATARLDIQMADLGNFTFATNYSSIGWGALDQKLDQRAKEKVLEYDVATNLELGKFFPNKWNLRVPFYAQFAKTTKTPQYDPYDLDLTIEEKLATAQTPEEEQEFKERALDVTTIRTINFTNVRKERSQGNRASKPKPWDISNVSVGYSYSQIKHRDPIIERDELNDYRATLDYNFTKKANYIQPFKKVKGKGWKFIKEFNFNPLPNSFSFNTQVKRVIGVTKYRLPKEVAFEFEDRRFDWDRRYGLQWDMAKSLKFTFSALNSGVVDEYKKVGIGADTTFVDASGIDVGNISEDERKQFVRDNFYDFGRTKNYNHQFNLNYTLPFKHIPGFQWISSKASYSSGYTWSASALNVVDTLGNVIQNNQTRSINATFSFDKLYKSISFLKNIEGGGSSRSSRNRNPNRRSGEDDSKESKLDSKNKEDRKKDSKGPSTLTKVLVRPLLLLRDIRFSYKEVSSTVVPGFMPRPSYLGLSDGFSAPGWSFALGLQPDIDIANQNNFLRSSANSGWLVTNRLFNQQVQQRNIQDYELKIKLEPFKDFKINVNMKKSYRRDHTEEFKNTSEIPGNPIFEHLALRDLGSFEVTYFALNTLFNDDIVGLFQDFEANREIISQRLPNNTVDEHEIDLAPYLKGYGRESNGVLVPAFLAAYSGSDANTVNLNVIDDVRRRGYIPKPNWTVRYDGLSKLPGLKDIFSSFTITHGYKSTLVVNSFNTDPKYDANNPFGLSDLETNRNYHTRLDIPQIVINEQFSPIIGVDIKTRNDMNIEFNYKKSRTLQLLAQEPALKETRTTEYVFGFGYTLNDVNIGFLTGGKKNKKRRDRKKEEEDKTKDANSGRGSSVNSNVRTLSIKFDFSFRDDVTYDHKPDLIAGDPQRGLKSLRFSPSIDYDINKNLTMRMFFDFSRTRPYLTTSYPITSAQGGITMRFNLN